MDFKRLRRQVVIFLIILLLGLWNLKAQVIYSEDFSATPTGSMTSPKWEVQISRAAPDIFWVQNHRFDCKNLKGEGVWSSSLIDISAYSRVKVSVSLSEAGMMEAGDYIRVYYNADGKGETLFSTEGNQEGRFGAAVARQADISGNYLQVVIHVRNNDFNEKHSFDNILVEAQPRAIEWTGATDSMWIQPGNWSGGRVPAASEEVIIKAAAAFQPVISGLAECGLLEIEKGAALRLSSGAVLNITEDFNCAGNFISGPASVRLSGSAPQAIHNEKPIEFYNLEVNNQSEDGVRTYGKINVRNRLSLKDGRLFAGDTVSVENISAEAVSAYSDSSYVVGNLKRKIGRGAEYDFPVGLGNYYGYHPVRIDANALEGVNYITASFQQLERVAPSEIRAKGDDFVYDYISPEGMWILSPDAQPTGGWYNLRLSLQNISGVTDNLFGILKRPQGSGAGAWSADFGTENAFGGEGRKATDGYALKMYCTGFSEFAIGGGGVPIPIELLRFDAQLSGGKVNLNWSTATETNNSFFTIEKSNGKDFKEVVRVDSEGNSSELHDYSAVDEKPFTGISYYRLKQTDINGQEDYSNTVTVKNESLANEIIVFPNPAEGSVKLKLSAALPEIETVIYDQLGAVSYNKTFHQPGNASVIEIPLKDKLPPGVYYLQVSAGKEDLLIQQIVIQ